MSEDRITVEWGHFGSVGLPFNLIPPGRDLPNVCRIATIKLDAIKEGYISIGRDAPEAFIETDLPHPENPDCVAIYHVSLTQALFEIIDQIATDGRSSPLGRAVSRVEESEDGPDA